MDAGTHASVPTRDPILLVARIVDFLSRRSLSSRSNSLGLSSTRSPRYCVDNRGWPLSGRLSASGTTRRGDHEVARCVFVVFLCLCVCVCDTMQYNERCMLPLRSQTFR